MSVCLSFLSLHTLGKNVNTVGAYYPASSQGPSDANHRPLSKGTGGPSKLCGLP